MNIPTLFENTHFIVIDKPSGLVVHPFDHSTEETLLDFLQTHAPETFLINNNKTLLDGRTINLGGLVHKLDRDTRGVLVVAKTQDAFNELTHAFASHAITKTYHALVEGIVQEDTLTIDAPLGRNKKDYKQTAFPKNPRGELRHALTSLRVLHRNTTTTLVELTPKTGRTHQLRAHMTYIGHPIVGDVAYGSATASSRIMLHAHTLTFTLFGVPYTFEAPSPFTFDITK